MDKHQIKLKQLGVRMISQIKNLPEVKASAIIGSVAMNLADKYSDLDLAFLCSRFPSEKTRIEILRKMGVTGKIKQVNSGVPYGVRDMFFYEEIPVGVEYKLISEYEKQVKEVELNGLSGAQPEIEIITHTVYVKELFDSQKYFKNFRQRLLKMIKDKKMLKNFLEYALPILEGTRLEKTWPQNDFFEIYERKNFIYLNEKISKSISIFLTVLYYLNDDYYYNSKWASETIKSFRKKPRNCVEKLQNISKLGNTGKELEQKLELLQSLVKDLKKLL